MGCSFSCRKSTSTFNTIRVVHLNGYVEDFEYPVTVGEVTGKPPRHFVCNRAQLVSGGGPKPLKPPTQLEPGHVYFLLPYSTIQSAEASPVDLAFIARKLTRIATTKQPQTNKSQSPLRKSRSNGSSPVWRSPGSSPNWFSGSPTMSPNRFFGSPAMSPNRFFGQPMGEEPESNDVVYGLQRSSKARSWKPILDTIREKSFNRRSESDLPDNIFADSKIGVE